MIMETVSAQNRKTIIEKMAKMRDVVESFCNKESFPFIVVAVAFLFHLFALDLVGIITFALLATVAVLFFKDCKSGLAIVMSTVFIVSIKNGPGYSTGEDYYSKKEILIPILCVGALLVIAMGIRCIRNRKNFKASKMFLSTVVLAISFVLAGAGSKYYSESVWFGVLMGLSYIGIYFAFTGCMGSRENLLDYISTVLTALCLLIAIQVVEVYAKHLISGGTFDSRWKDKIVFGWGVSNIAGEMIVFFIPFVFYKIEHSKKFYNVYHAIALFCITMLVFTLNRAGLLFGIPMFAVLWIRLLIKTPHKNSILLTVVVYFSFALVVLISLTAFTEINKVFMYFREIIENLGDEGISMSRRDQLWAQAWGFFKKSPILGEGYASSFHAPISNSHANLFQTLTHNFIMQTVGSGGIVGVSAMIFYLLNAIKLSLKKYEGKFHVICFGILYFCISLFDTTYFITYSVMILMLIIAMAEKFVAKGENDNGKN